MHVKEETENKTEKGADLCGLCIPLPVGLYCLDVAGGGLGLEVRCDLRPVPNQPGEIFQFGDLRVHTARDDKRSLR